MNAKTLEAVRKHGMALLAAFPNATEKDPVTLCKKLRRIETAVYGVILHYTNGECSVTIEQVDEAVEALEAARVLLIDHHSYDVMDSKHVLCPACTCDRGDKVLNQIAAILTKSKGPQ